MAKTLIEQRRQVTILRFEAKAARDRFMKVDPFMMSSFQVMHLGAQMGNAYKALVTAMNDYDNMRKGGAK